MNRVKGVFCFFFSAICFYYTIHWFIYSSDHSFYAIIEQFSYLTNQTTLVVSIYMFGASLYFLGARAIKKYIFGSTIKTAIMSYSFCISLGYYIGVARFYSSNSEFHLNDPLSVMLHLVCPVTLALLYHHTPFVGRITTKTIILLGLYPMSYLFYAAYYPSFSGQYVYPIFDPTIVSNELNMVFLIFSAFIGLWVIGAVVGARHNHLSEN